ncbi:hypothetical protein J2Z60_001266 [Lactobacillus colini]|uniref:S-layer protein C-terminal domain-containing protein n=1 Tax=Lactobacillus colini TaxID=1819254 RepID=A0ABS4MEH3_9LACO|nr:SLAP domain-containing protein [Lactobacillus colini]MBP2058089.1 hypothetical protein [Lactobacillus colini]
MRKLVRVLTSVSLLAGFATIINTTTVNAAPRRIKVQQKVKTYDSTGKFIENTKNVKSVKYSGFRFINGQKAYRVGQDAYVLAGDSKAWNKKYLFKVIPKVDNIVLTSKKGKKLALNKNKVYKVTKVKISKKTGKQLYRLGKHYWIRASQVRVVGNKY